MLHSEHRPKTWADFVGNERAVKQARGALAMQAERLAAGNATDGLAMAIVGRSGGFTGLFSTRGEVMLTRTMIEHYNAAHLRLMALGVGVQESATLLHTHQADVDTLAFIAKRPPKTVKAWVESELIYIEA